MFKKTIWAILGLSLLVNLSSCAEGNMSAKNQGSNLNLGPDLSSKHPHPPAPVHKE